MYWRIGMAKTEIAQAIAYIYSCLSGIMVNGDRAIMMGEGLKTLRALSQALQKDIESEVMQDKPVDGGGD